MALTAEWRIFGEFDVVLVLDEDGIVREAMTAGPVILNDFLTTMSGLHSWRGDHAIEGEKRRPEPWGALVISRAESGEIIDMDPERFWTGVHIWFRSRGVDYDTPIPV
ncbi:MAG: hypothetical protein OXL97_10645 [Chloroflexota bacterium]|nr:hypothetical protein [Chloroflexota bacterium]MDE2886134.1 hypothetical protein [Chloroflexota bacterium]